MPELKTKWPITDQGKFICYHETMEGENYQNEDEKLHYYLYQHYKLAAESDAQMSDNM